MASEQIEGDPPTLKSTPSLSTLPAVRTRTSRGSPVHVDPSILPPKAETGTQWVRKIPPVIGMREKGADTPTGSSGSAETGADEIPRSASPLDSQSSRTRTISSSSNEVLVKSGSIDKSSAAEGDAVPLSPKSTAWAPSQPAASVRLGVHSQGHKDHSKKSPANANEPIAAPTPATATAPGANLPTASPSPSPDVGASGILPKIIPNQSMPLLSTLFEQTHSLLDRKEEDWAIANYDQLRHVISQLFNSVPLIQQMLALVKRIAPIFIERHQEREATNRYKEVMYLAEKIGGDAAAEQIELNLLVADSYILRSELALNDQELAVNIAAYSNEALWLCHTYKLHSRLNDCKAKLDLAEALFCAIFLVNTNIVLRLNQILMRRPQEFARVIKLVERTLHQLFKNQAWLMIRKLYQSGILQACTQASQKLNDDSYLLQMLFIQTQVNLTLLNPSELAPPPATINSAELAAANAAKAAASASSSSASSTSSSGSVVVDRRPSLTGSKPTSPSPPPILQGFSGWLPKDVPSNWSGFRTQLETMRAEINTAELAQNLLQPEYVQTVQNSINTKLYALVKSVFDYCVEMVGDPPCPFSIFCLGSLSRLEAAPYSDLEYGFIIGEESKRESTYWKDLWTIFEFTFICFGERVGLHTDDQGSPKTPNFRGTPAQLLDLFLHPLDAHDISTAFSMLRPNYISSYPAKAGRELHDTYINLVNHVLNSNTDGFHQYTKIGSLFLEDHLTQLKGWLPKENDACVELKTNYIQPLVYIVTDIALSNGCYVNCANAGVCTLVDALGDGKNSYLGFSADFARSIKTLFLACYGLKVLAQLHYHEQFEGDKVSVTPPTGQALISTSNGSSPAPSSLNVTGGLYYLTREQVYWLRMALSVVLKPLYTVLPVMLSYIQSNPWNSPTPTAAIPSTQSLSGSSSSNSGSSGSGFGGSGASGELSYSTPKNWARVDPIIDAAELLVDPKFDPYASSKSSALEDTKELIRSLIATLIFRDASISRYRHYYKQLGADFKLLYRATVTSHAASQGAKVQMLTYVFDAYASPDGTRPLIERLKVHFRDHLTAIAPQPLYKLFATWEPAKFGGTPLSPSTPVCIKVAPPAGWPSQSRLKGGSASEPVVSTIKPTSISKYEGPLGFELAVSLLHFAVIGFGAPLLDVRLVAPALGAKEIPVVFTEHAPGDLLSTVISSDPSRLRLLDSKTFTELIFVNLLLMCDARAEDYVFEPIAPEDPKAGYRLSRVSFANSEPNPEPIVINKERATLKVCNILFCMPSMLQTVHPYAVEEFLSLTPTHLMTRLVQDIETTNKDWKSKLDAAAIATLNRSTQPAPLPGATSVLNLPHYVLGLFFDRIVKLQKVLTSSPRSTHLDLLRAIDPVVGQIYHDAFSSAALVPSSPVLALATAAGVAPHTTIFDRSALLQATGSGLMSSSSGSASGANDAMERLSRLEARREFPLNNVYAVASTSPKLYARIEKLRRYSHAILPSNLPSTEPVFEKSDHTAHMEELRSQLMNLPLNSTVTFPREDMLKSNAMKEKLLCSVDFAKIDVKKQRQTLLSLFDSVKFVSQLRIRHCPELDHQRLSRLLSGDTLKQLSVLDLRGMTGMKTPTVSLIASLENLEYLNLSGSDLKSIATEKWTKREAMVMERLVWLNVSKCSGLQHLNLRSPNLRQLDITGCSSLTELKVWSGYRTSVLGLMATQIPFARVISEVLSVSWWFSAESVPSSLEKIFFDVASGRDHRMLIHIPLNETTLRVIAEIVKHGPTLEIVDLSSSIISGDELFESITTSAVFNPSVKLLDMSGCGIKPSKVQLFTQQCSARSDLKTKF